MIISNKFGDTFSLGILGYQFPQKTGDNNDGNWLIIRLTVALDGTTWNITDPCMSTHELHYMADWFQKLMDHETTTDECDFTEPAFKMVLKSNANQDRILQFQVSPSANLFMDEGNTFLIDVPVEEINFGEVMNNLIQYQRKYPVRSCYVRQYNSITVTQEFSPTYSPHNLRRHSSNRSPSAEPRAVVTSSWLLKTTYGTLTP